MNLGEDAFLRESLVNILEKRRIWVSDFYRHPVGYPSDRILQKAGVNSARGGWCAPWLTRRDFAGGGAPGVAI